MLDCFHMFCTPCIERLIKGKSILSCPTCSEICSVHDNDIDGFNLYPFHEFKTEECESDRNYGCQMCDEKSVFSKCMDCDQNMCSDCHKYHLRHKRLRNHKVQILEKLQKADMEKEQKICKQHNLQYSEYCKSCNVTMCKVCAKQKHPNHKILDVNDAAVTMKHCLKLALSGLKSKISYVSHFLDNCKIEEDKYNTHIKQAEAEMKSSASNLKDALCSAIDLFLSQNIADLESEKNIDKQLIRNYVKKNEREAKFLINLTSFTEETLRCANGLKITQLASSLCKQINHCETSCFQSKLTLYIPKYKAGDVSLKPLREFMGIVGRDEKTEISLRLDIPSNELSVYPTFGDIKKIRTISIDTVTSKTSFASNCGHIYLTQVEKHQLEGRYMFDDKVEFRGIIECKDFQGETKFRKWIANLERWKWQFKIIGINSQTIFVLVSNQIKIFNIKHNGNAIELSESTPLEIEIPDITLETCCLTDNGNILVHESRMKAFLEFRENGTLVKRTFVLTALKKGDFSKVAILKTLSNRILLSFGNEIFSFDILGDLKNHFHFNGSANFTDMCTDRHGNVFVSDSLGECVCLLTSDGHFVRDLNHRQFKEEFEMVDYLQSYPLTVDACGNLLQLCHDNISVYSYL